MDQTHAFDVYSASFVPEPPNPAYGVHPVVVLPIDGPGPMTTRRPLVVLGAVAAALALVLGLLGVLVYGLVFPVTVVAVVMFDVVARATGGYARLADLADAAWWRASARWRR